MTCRRQQPAVIIDDPVVKKPLVYPQTYQKQLQQAFRGPGY